MPLRKTAAATKRLIEQGQQELLERKIPAGAIRDQLSAANLGPAGNTGNGYTPDPDAVTRVQVRKNSTGSTLERRRMNFIEGNGISITLGDDSGGEEADITIASGVAVGNATSTGALGSEPGSPTAGDLYLPDNAGFIERYSGSAWVPWGPIYPLTKPIDADFAWINQGSATVDTTNGGILLAAPSTTGNSLRIRKKAAPSTPYTITAMFVPTYLIQSIQGYGLLFRESSSGKCHAFGIQYQTVTTVKFIPSMKFTDATTYNSDYTSIGGAPGVDVGPSPIFFRIADDGTNRICSLSHDGIRFTAWHTVGRTDFLTANEVGFFVRDVNGRATEVRLLSWKEG